jgi:hypothetical protein
MSAHIKRNVPQQEAWWDWGTKKGGNNLYKSQLQTYMNQQLPKTSKILEIKMVKLRKTSD